MRTFIMVPLRGKLTTVTTPKFVDEEIPTIKRLSRWHFQMDQERRNNIRNNVDICPYCGEEMRNLFNCPECEWPD